MSCSRVDVRQGLKTCGDSSHCVIDSNREKYDVDLQSLGDFELCQHMLDNEPICRSMLENLKYSLLHANIKIDKKDAEPWVNRFLCDCVVSYLVVGIIGFEFCEDTSMKENLTPHVIPFQRLKYDFIINHPHPLYEIANVAHKDDISSSTRISVKKSRIFTFKFFNFVTAGSSTTPLHSLLGDYRRLLHVRAYNEIIQKQALQTDIFLTRPQRTDTGADVQGTDFLQMSLANAQTRRTRKAMVSETDKDIAEEADMQRQEKVEEKIIERTNFNEYVRYVALPCGVTPMTAVRHNNPTLLDEQLYLAQYEKSFTAVFTADSHDDMHKAYDDNRKRSKHSYTQSSVSAIQHHLREMEKRNNSRVEFQEMLSAVISICKEKNIDAYTAKMQKYIFDREDNTTLSSHKSSADYYNYSIPIQAMVKSGTVDVQIQYSSILDFDFMNKLYENRYIDTSTFGTYFRNSTGLDFCVDQAHDTSQPEDTKHTHAVLHDKKSSEKKAKDSSLV